ncbi:hypothetical protein EV700_2950 [Fluviicoccus keumensis]|uniref:Uncharacterized protein n=1 Tax=Fluviicoccus keumensis TaxID=1435465 RepID=A0A4Q7YKA1_9GAMM|nr:hypothetical protein [Fluviicoccus keumensis]RZU37081.1 hypothetical protein EV700_2950 [Fluviicoccus keumensis]
MSTLIIVIATAILSSLLTLTFGYWIFRRFWERDMEVRFRQLHDDIGRTVETRVRRAVTESLSDPRPADMLRETTWKAAKSGSDLLSDSLSNLIGKWRRQTDDV